MESEERKQRFAALILEMVEEYGGIKNKLAQKLGIKSPRLTIWSQGKVDPASLEIFIFDRIATVKGCSVDELAKLLALKPYVSETPLHRLRGLVREMLAGKSQEQLGKKLHISKNTIRGWLNPTKNIDPSLIPAGTIANLATERGWTIERLLAYLNLKKNKEIEEDVIALIQNQTKQLSFPSRVKLLSWLSGDFEKELSNLNVTTVNTRDEKILSEKKICILLEQEDVSHRKADLFEIASLYSSNLVLHLQLQPENIKIATPSSIPDSLDDFDILILDINSQESPCIQLLDSLEFPGDILVFADPSLPDEVRDRLSKLATDVILKPVPWKNLKDLPYFS